MITVEEFKHLEDLSKLELSDKEREAFLPSFNAIVEFASLVNKVELKDGKQNIRTVKLKDLRRDDLIMSNALSQDKVISNAPMKSKGCFVVPKIVD